MIGTNSQSCWLAEACKVLILLSLGRATNLKNPSCFSYVSLPNTHHATYDVVLYGFCSVTLLSCRAQLAGLC